MVMKPCSPAVAVAPHTGKSSKSALVFLNIKGKHVGVVNVIIHYVRLANCQKSRWKVKIYTDEKATFLK